MMQSEQEETPDVTRLKPNPAFRKTAWLQIYLPFIFFIVILAAVVTILWVGGAGTYSGWADAALVILIIPALVVGVLVFAILVGMVYGVMYIIGQIPGPAKRAQEITSRISVETRRFADLAARPVMVPRAVIRALIETIRYLASVFSKEG